MRILRGEVIGRLPLPLRGFFPINLLLYISVPYSNYVIGCVCGSRG